MGVEPTSTAEASNAHALIARLGASYVRRASPNGASPSGEPSATGQVLASEGSTVPCTVLAVEPVDADRRWLWPADAELGRPTAVALRAHPGYIEVISSGAVGGPVTERRLDRRGRVRLPTGVLRWAGVQTGDRLALVVHDGDGDRMVLVPASRLRVPRLDLP